MNFYRQHLADPLTIDDEYPTPNRMSIETSSKCNRRCSFCPISLGVRDHEQRLMNDALYTSILEQVPSTVKCIELFRLNEPLLDKKYHDRIRELRARHRRITIYCATNGDVLLSNFDEAKTKHRLWQLQKAGLNVISIDEYDTDKRYNYFRRIAMELARFRQFGLTDNRYQAHPTSRLSICVTDMRPGAKRKGGVTSSWTNCGMNKKLKAPAWNCPRPSRHFVVLYDGTVPVCCVVNPGDAAVPRMGDMKTNTLTEIWNNEKFHEYRLHLQDKKRDLPGCDICDAKVAYAFAARRVS